MSPRTILKIYTCLPTEGYSVEYGTLSLTAAACLFLLIATIVGWLRPRLKFWKFVDTIYYFLGIAGIVLFYFSGERDRALAEMRLRLEQVTAAIHQIGAPPAVQLNTSILKLFPAAYRSLEVVQQLGETCHMISSPSGVCVETSRYRLPISSAFNGFKFPIDNETDHHNAVATIDFCRRTESLLETLAGLDSDYQDIKIFISKTSNNDRQNIAWMLSNERTRAQVRRVEESRDRMLQSLPPHQREFISETWETKIRFISSLTFSLSVCFMVPEFTKESVILRVSWQNQSLDLDREKLSLQERIENSLTIALGTPRLAFGMIFCGESSGPSF